MFGLRPGEIAAQSGERLLADSRKRLLRHGRLGAGGTLPQHGLLALQLGHRRCVPAVRFPERRPASIHARMRSEEHTSELQSLMRTSYAVFCLKKKTQTTQNIPHKHTDTTN